MDQSHSQAPRASSPSRRRRATMPVFLLLLIAVLTVTGFMLVRAPVAEYVVEIGPIDLPAGADHHNVPQPKPRAIALPFDGWFRGFFVEIVDERGQPIPKQLLHHVNLIAPNRRELFSPIMLRLGAAGPETQPIKLPGLLGYRVRPGDSLLMTAMLHNPTTTGHRKALLRVHLTYTPVASRVLEPFGVYPFYLDVMPPAGIHAYDLPPGRSEKSWEGRPAVAGRIMGLGGHLHKYSIALRFEDVTEKRVLWVVTPTKDADGNITSIPTKYFLPFGLRINPEHRYRLTAIYDNPTGSVLPGGGMGALGGALIPDEPDTWPHVAADHPWYQHDLRVTYGGHHADAAPTAAPHGHGPGAAPHTH